MKWKIRHLKLRLEQLVEEEAKLLAEIERIISEIERFEEFGADAEMAEFTGYATQEV